MDSEPYVDACSLWVARPGEDAVCVVPAGELTLDRLAQQPEDTTGAVHYLKIPNPKEGGDRSRRRAKSSHTNPAWPKETFRAGRGRLARVGYISRLADALFSLALLARGRVPGGDVEGGRVLYGRFMEKGQRFTYHGNVVRQDGWIVLRYWLFYAFNDWRSNVFGANDHEADWEKIFIYLSESESGEVPPEAPVGRSGAGEGRRASRGVRLRRLARDPLFPGRVPDRARFSAAPRHLRGPEDLAALLVRDAAPVRRRGLQGEALRTVHHPLRGLRARGRVVGRTGAGQGVGPPAPHEPGAIVGLWVPRAMGTLHPGSLRGRGR